MLIGYARVATNDQTLNLQLDSYVGITAVCRKGIRQGPTGDVPGTRSCPVEGLPVGRAPTGERLTGRGRDQDAKQKSPWRRGKRATWGSSMPYWPPILQSQLL